MARSCVHSRIGVLIHKIWADDLCHYKLQKCGGAFGEFSGGQALLQLQSASRLWRIALLSLFPASFLAPPCMFLFL
ncbi:hypothetical protein Ancab_004498, partial [Ancistrocladus abbreviatus]